MTPPVIIGVAGGSGSGKTTVVTEIIRQLGHDTVSRIQHDWYYVDRRDLPLAERALLNYDHPNSLETDLLVTHIEVLRHGETVRAPVYDYTTHTRTDRTVTVEPRRVVIVEGILILAEPALRDAMDIRVFVDTDADIRFIRRLTRDLTERQRTVDSVIEQYLRTVQPMHLEFVEPSRRHAHLIIPEGGQNRVAVDMLIAKIRAVVAGS